LANSTAHKNSNTGENETQGVLVPHKNCLDFSSVDCQYKANDSTAN
jgi:hypothetical protein